MIVKRDPALDGIGGGSEEILALKKGCRERRAALAHIEYRARLVLKRFRERCAN